MLAADDATAAEVGVLTGRWLGSPRPLPERLTGLFGTTSLLMVAGLVSHWVLPINPESVDELVCALHGGMAAAALATCVWLIDVLGWKGWTTPLVVFGVNPLVAFVGSGMMARLIHSVIRVPYGGETLPVKRVTYETLFTSLPRVMHRCCSQ